MNSPQSSIEVIRRGINKRNRKERQFQWFGKAAIGFSLLCIVVLFADIIGKGFSAFQQTHIQLTVHYDIENLGVSEDATAAQLRSADYEAIIKQALRERFTDVVGRGNLRALNKLVSAGAGYTVRDRLHANQQLLGQSETLWLLASGDVDTYLKKFAGKQKDAGRLNEQQRLWVTQLIDSGELKKRFNTNFFTLGDSRQPETAGIWGATIGSALTLVVTLLLSFPIGVAAAVYLEEYAPRNRWTELIEVNINNLAAVPSIIFGLLGLAIFINFFGLPRSAPLVGGMVLTLMTLPTIIISSRASIKSVPPSIRDAALAVGASKMQMVMHHVLPNAMPGMLTGAIIGMAQALGETAPLLMIGMVAFIVDVPTGVVDSATVLPVQIYLWSDSPERGFVALTSAAIMVLLVFLIAMNTLAVILRKKLENRW